MVVLGGVKHGHETEICISLQLNTRHLSSRILRLRLNEVFYASLQTICSKSQLPIPVRSGWYMWAAGRQEKYLS